MIRRLRRRLAGRSVFVLCRAVVVVATIRAFLWLYPYGRVLRTVAKERHTYRHMDAEGEAKYMRDVIWAVRAVARRTLGDSPCLTQALAVKWMLRTTNADTILRIGVAKSEDNSLNAHAWLECNGVILIGGGRSPFSYSLLEQVRSQ